MSLCLDSHHPTCAMIISKFSSCSIFWINLCTSLFRTSKNQVSSSDFTITYRGKKKKKSRKKVPMICKKCQFNVCIQNQKIFILGKLRWKLRTMSSWKAICYKYCTNTAVTALQNPPQNIYFFPLCPYSISPTCPGCYFPNRPKFVYLGITGKRERDFKYGYRSFENMNTQRSYFPNHWTRISPDKL